MSAAQIGGDNQILAVRQPTQIIDARRELRDLLGLAAVSRDLPQIGLRTVVTRLLAGDVAMRGKGDPTAIGRQGRAASGLRRVSYRTYSSRTQVQPGHCFTTFQSGALKTAKYATPVGMKGQLAAGLDTLGQPHVRAILGIDDSQRPGIKVACADIRNPLSVRGPRRLDVLAIAGRQAPHLAAGSG